MGKGCLVKGTGHMLGGFRAAFDKRALGLFLALLMLGLGCAGSQERDDVFPDHELRDYSSVSDEDIEKGTSKLRARIARTDDDVERGMIRLELSFLELERARRAHNIFGYRRFLAEFPRGEAASTGWLLLEALRFDEASEESSVQAWRVFLREFPEGKHADEARTRLATLEIQDAIRAQDLAEIRRVLARYRAPDDFAPEEERALWAALVKVEDSLSWNEARGADLRAVEAYLAERPLGRFRDEAFRLKEELIEQAILEEEDLELAWRRLNSPRPSRPSKATVAELELRAAARKLDLAKLESLAQDSRLRGGGEEAQAQAQALAQSLRRSPLSRANTALFKQASRGSGLRARQELMRLARRGDPQSRAVLLFELAEWGHLDDLNFLLQEIDSNWLIISQAAVESLGVLGAAYPPKVWQAVVHSRIAVLRTQGFNASSLKKVAALQESSGDVEAALVTWREISRLNPEDPLAFSRILKARRASLLAATPKNVGQATTSTEANAAPALSSPASRSRAPNPADVLAVLSDAKGLLEVAVNFGDHRWPGPVDPDARYSPDEGQLLGLPREVGLLRQLCAALDLLSFASEVLEEHAKPVDVEMVAATEIRPSPVPPSIARRIEFMEAKRSELEAIVERRGAGYDKCSPLNLAPERVLSSRTKRLRAIEALAQAADSRLLPALENWGFSPAPEIQTAARQSLESIASSGDSRPGRELVSGLGE